MEVHRVEGEALFTASYLSANGAECTLKHVII